MLLLLLLLGFIPEECMKESNAYICVYYYYDPGSTPEESMRASKAAVWHGCNP
jgi:hypothetical protein